MGKKFEILNYDELPLLFNLEIGQRLSENNRDLIIIDRKVKYRESYNKNRGKTYTIREKVYKYKCLKCGFDCGEHYKKGEYRKEMWISEGNLLAGKGCSCCCHNPQIVKPGINDVATTNPDLVKYFQGGYDEAKKYTFRSNQVIYPICPDCGKAKTKSIKIDRIYENEGINCTCGDGFSYGHKYIFSMLKQLNVDFSDNVRFDWCKYKMKNKIKQGEYDFVVEDKKIIIEVDGYFHRNDNIMNGQTKDTSNFIDNEKDRLAKENGYKIIRLIYDHRNREKLNKVILLSEIKKYFNLENVDWKECIKYALSNVSKLVANYWNNKEDWETTTDLMKHFGLSRKTILNYLGIWSELGYCNYDSELESKKRYEKLKILTKEKCSIPVECFVNMKSVGLFSSVSELERKSEEVFGVKLNSSNISLVCNGKKSKYKGFTFKYVENNE